MTDDRTASAFQFRLAAAELARTREHPEHTANGDEQRYASACYPMSFTKGLEHCGETGLVAHASDFEAFRAAIDDGFVAPFTTRVPVPTGITRRQWEAPTAGVVFEVEGPDPQAVTMPPAPRLGSAELDFEMAEVLELALVRDVHFSAFSSAGPASAELKKSIKCLNALPYATSGFEGRPRITAPGGQLDRQTVFRGSSPGVEVGPYVSQFLLIGNTDPSGDASGVRPEDGRVTYGGQAVDQRVLEARVGDDYMTTWSDWLAVQRGEAVNGDGSGQDFTGKRRFIATPRDLATYVHFDALYQAYLNACLILLSNRTPFDPAFDLLSGSNGHSLLTDPANGQRTPVNAGGFALWGGPHILSLVTEVATRALKAVRFQKFNVHLRLRPEALGGRIERAAEIDSRHPETHGRFGAMAAALEKTLERIEAHNQNVGGEKTRLLPMAFQEGSPMHPTYGAGHATVAGACVTMLKAFFDTSAVFARVDGLAGFYGKAQLEAARADKKGIEFGAYVASEAVDASDAREAVGAGEKLVFQPCSGKEAGCPLTLEGELNKLAANISIGRNMAGVHYYSDYHDSVRMGERIAIGILEEQALGYATDRFVLSVPTFDGDVVRVGAR
ncbi:MAG: bromoperoxidase [Planctomycetota bacterium]